MGWRSPLRSSAMEVMKEGVVGDAQAVEKLKRRTHVRSIDETFKSMSAHVEDQTCLRGWHCLMPVMVGVPFFILVYLRCNRFLQYRKVLLRCLLMLGGQKSLL